MAYGPIRTPDDLAARLQPSVTREDHWLDFKGLSATTGRPYAKGGDGKDECRLDVAQFANASGGSIVYGAVEANHLFSKYATVPNPQEFARWLDDVVKVFLEPVPALEVHVIRTATGEDVVVANVPPLVRLVGLRRRGRDAYEFPIRTVDSRRFLTLTEIEARMQDRDRAHRLQLNQIKQSERVGLDAHVDNELGHYDWNVSAVGEDVVVLTKEKQVVVPLAYVRAVYRPELPGAVWIVDLDCYLSKHKQDGRIVVTKSIPEGRNHGHYKQRGL